MPKHTASASILWSNKIVNASVRGFYRSKQFSSDDNSTEIDPYFTLDLQLSKQVLENLILSLDIQDIFDNKHMISNEAISPGRIITGGIAVKF